MGVMLPIVQKIAYGGKTGAAAGDPGCGLRQGLFYHAGQAGCKLSADSSEAKFQKQPFSAGERPPGLKGGRRSLRRRRSVRGASPSRRDLIKAGILENTVIFDLGTGKNMAAALPGPALRPLSLTRAVRGDAAQGSGHGIDLVRVPSAGRPGGGRK